MVRAVDETIVAEVELVNWTTAALLRDAVMPDARGEFQARQGGRQERGKASVKSR